MAIANPDRTDADRARDARDKPEATLALPDLQPGDAVVDLFAGGGYYAYRNFKGRRPQPVDATRAWSLFAEALLPFWCQRPSTTATISVGPWPTT